MPTTAQRLIYAVRTGNYDRLRELISQGADLAARSPAGRTALHAAAEEGDHEAALILLQAGADVNARMVNGLTPLHLAASYGGFFDLGDPDTERRDPCNRLRHHPTNVELAKVIVEIMKEQHPELPVEQEPDDKIPDEHRTDLFLAVMDCYANPAEFYQELKSRGIDVDRLDPHFAEFLQGRPRFLRMVELLLQHHADIHIHAPEDRNATVLGDAVELGTAQMMELLLKHGANPNPTSADDFPPASLVATTLESGNVDVAAVLIKAGAKFDPNGEQLLHKAASNARREVVVWLLERGADINLRDESGNTPLLSACGHGEVISELIARGADGTARNNQGDGRLHLSAPWLTSLKQVPSPGLPIDAPNHQGRTPLHIAASAANAEGIPVLLAAGASISVQDHEGNTPLHRIFFSEEYRPDVEFPTFHALVSAGADRSIKNLEGKTPYDLAVKVGYPREYQELLDPAATDPKMFIWLGQSPYDQFLPRAMVPFELDGLTWPSVDHYFHAQKTSDPKFREEVRQTKSVNAAFGRLHDHNVKRSASWSRKCDAIMQKALLEKFRQNADLRRELLATGDATLISDSNCEDYWTENQKSGFNFIGKLLMNIRAQLGT